MRTRKKNLLLKSSLLLKNHQLEKRSIRKRLLQIKKKLLINPPMANTVDKNPDKNPEQSAFQKGKSTIQQLFTLRLLIEIVKKTDTVLYIGMFDLGKAFDKVSRFKLIKKLIAMGISKCMLQVINMCTICILNYRLLKGLRTY